MIFLRNESFRTYLRLYPLTSFFIGVNTVVMLFTTVLGWQNNPYMLYAYTSFAADFPLQDRWWTILTFSFVHNGWMHFLFNMFMMYLIAPPLEQRLGRSRYLLLWLWLIFSTALGLYALRAGAAVGASGVDYGFLGLYLYYMWRGPRWLDRQSESVILAFIVLGAISTLIIPGVSIAGHLGGFVGGLLFGFLFARKRWERSAWERRFY
ncbi:MAG: rhomboid family intramembrane serine protease [Candidatus Carbobacillus altaicus]|nr:rhomboid family intramembrane serine protease [Candidatus Carbobacillus altaicus]